MPSIRDMDLTAFARILGELVRRVPGAFASALVDNGGETVDYAGNGDPFDMKIAAAHLRIILNDLERLGRLGAPRVVVIRGARRSLIGRTLPDGYALVVLLRRRAGFTSTERAFATCERELAVEAGWPVATAGSRPWFPVHVEVDDRGRPWSLMSLRVRRAPVSVEVMGAVVGLPSRERGFRVRIRAGNAAGAELTLVREPGRTWYADEDLDALSVGERSPTTRPEP